MMNNGNTLLNLTNFSPLYADDLQILEAAGKEGLDEKITIVPVGGLDKVATFISLLRSNNLNIVCLLDTFKDAKGKAKLDDLIEQRLITEKKIKF
ncbi:MAG: hypothetical protein ACRC2O_07125, partial [Chitinophagaceae bacterium]